MSGDLRRAIALLSVVGGNDCEVRAFTVEGQPVAKARARQGRYGHYTPTRTVQAEKTIAKSAKGIGSDRFPSNVAVAIVFFRGDQHRIDIDNLQKTVLDGITKAGTIWEDDSQVTALVSAIELDRDRPRTVVAVAPHKSSLLRGDARRTRICVTCGEAFRPHSPNSVAKFCSRACRSTRAARQICDDCGGATSAPHVRRCRSCDNLARKSAP